MWSFESTEVKQMVKNKCIGSWERILGGLYKMGIPKSFVKATGEHL